MKYDLKKRETNFEDIIFEEEKCNHSNRIKYKAKRIILDLKMFDKRTICS